MKPSKYPGLFKSYKRSGRQWLKYISPEDRKVFGKLGYIECGQKHGSYWWIHSQGGKARARTALRKRGKFAPGRQDALVDN